MGKLYVCFVVVVAKEHIGGGGVCKKWTYVIVLSQDLSLVRKEEVRKIKS